MSFDRPSAVPEAESQNLASDAPLDEESAEDTHAVADSRDDELAAGETLDEGIGADEVDDGFEIDGQEPESSEGTAAQDDVAEPVEDSEPVEDAEPVLYDDQVQPVYGIAGFTQRELIIVGAWLVGFVVSFFPLTPVTEATVWTSGIRWILAVGVPTVAVFLVVLRRLSPEGIRRVGSLGIDQFASVAASVSAVAWAEMLWGQAAASIGSGVSLVGWPVIVALLAAMGLVTLTVAAPLIPGLREDFLGRRETLAHRNANPVRPVVARPRPAAPVAETVEEPAAAVADSAQPVIEWAPDAGQPTYDPDDTHIIPRLDPATLSNTTASDAAVSDAAVSDAAVSDAAVSDAAVPDAPAVEVAPDAAAPDIAAVPTGAIDSTPASPRTIEPAALDVEAATAGAEQPLFADSAPVEVYNTGAVEVLQEIFEADGVTTPIAMPSTDTGTIHPEGLPLSRAVGEEDSAVGSASEETPEPAETSDAAGKPALRRDRAERQRQDPEPFWILAHTERDVLDELGAPLFRIGPNDWTLVIEDRGGAFVVRHEDGRIGYLHDMSDITKG